MESLHLLKIPFKDPLMVFAILLFIILLSQILFQKLKLPGMIGLILSGVLIGENGLHLIEREGSMHLLSSVGLIYIMFLAGLDLDLDKINKSRHRSVTFGMLTFIIPFSLGMVLCLYLLNFSFTGSLLVSSMFSTHTLVSYPIASRLGITRDDSVPIAVGGTIITDTIVLLLLAVITASHSGSLDSAFWIRMLISLSLYSIVIFAGVPLLTRWFFKNIEGEKTTTFLFVLFVLLFSGVLSIFAGLEPIIGAFMAGLAVNRLIPRDSSLMHHIEFIGNALFIPFFLIAVGMVVNLSVILDGPKALFIAATLTIAALLGKWLAAWATQKIFRMTHVQRGVLFGLSSTHAAATMAIILIGYQINLIDIHVLNGTIILILITCLTGSFVTEKSGRKLAISLQSQPVEDHTYTDRILIPVANPATIGKLFSFAFAVKAKNQDNKVIALAVVNDNEEDARQRLLTVRRNLNQALENLPEAANILKIKSRIDLNIVSGILHACKEEQVNSLIIGWGSGKKFFGTVFENLIKNSSSEIMSVNLIQPLNTIRSIRVYMPANAALETGFRSWIFRVVMLQQFSKAGLHIYCHRNCFEIFKKTCESITTDIKPVHYPFNIEDETIDFSGKNSLFIIIGARQSTISFTPASENIIAEIGKNHALHNFIVLFPEQNPKYQRSGLFNTEDLHLAPLQEKLEKISRLKNFIGRFIKN